jgi:hypothetical protein
MITAIVLDGFHKGHTLRMEYMPTLKLIMPRNITVDYCCDGEMTVNEPIASYVEYKECFRGVDRDVVLYSEKGESRSFLSWFNKHVVSGEPWNEYTILYFGYHSEPVRRKQDGTQMTEYDRGFERGIEEGRILQAKKSNLKQ